MSSNTAMNFTLSTTLLSHLQGSDNGVFVYAFAFDGNGNRIAATNLIGTLDPHTHVGTSGGAVQPVANFSLQLTNGTTLKGGNVIIVTQEKGPSGTSTLYNDVAHIGDVLDPATAKTDNFRYDAIEVTLLNTGSDVADLTNIVQFGSPIELSVSYTSLPTDTRGYNIVGATLAADLTALSPPGSQNYPFNPGSPLNEQRETLTLGNNVVPNPLNVATDWNAYVTGFENVVGDVKLASYFNGVAGGPPPSLSYYDVKFDGTNFWLVPDAAAALISGTTNYSIKIPAFQTSNGQVNALTQNIYAQTGTLDVYTSMGGTLVKHYDTFTPNNAYGDIVKYFVAGFDAGFWGGSANSPNPLVSGHVDVNQTWNWGANYAYEAINGPSGTGSYGYANTIGTGSGTVGDHNRQMFYDPFAAKFFQYSNAYGYSYSDLISNGGGVNPGISVFDPATGNNVTSINVTLFDRSEHPTGYLPPTNSYVAPTGATYSSASQSSTDQFLFDFSLAGKYAPVNGTPFTFRFYDPSDPSDPHATGDGFISLALPTNYAQYYQLSHSTGHWVLTGTNSGGLGFFDIIGVPLTADQTTGWYELVIGSGASAKTYNIYAQADTSGHFTSTSVVIDGGANFDTSVAQQVKFSFAPGGSITFDPGYFASTSLPPPSQILPAPLVGTLAHGTFQALDLTDLKRGDLAFSWAPSGLTDLVVGGNIVKLDLADAKHPGWVIMPAVTQSTIDGDWTTMLASQFGNGSYSAVMTQYKPTDVGLHHATDASSVPVNFTVNLDTLGLTTAHGGTALMLDQGGSATTGNWITFDTVHSTLPNATILLYATDANGNLVGRDGHTGPGVTLDDAVLAKIGSVADDSGKVLFSGEQSAYLPVGQQLHFAVQSGGNITEQSPGVHIDGSGSLSVKIDGAHGALELIAKVDNTLSADATLAGSQRQDDQAWIYLTQGQTVNVELAGSAQNINTAHFVHIDVDPTTGGWSVGGVVYGNTDAFRTAVQTHWDAGFNVQNGGGTFHTDVDFKATSGSGFYAPVLATQGGDIFVIGNANVDGHDHIRAYGQNTFGFEDLRADQHSDFDYNDMIMKVTVA